MESMKASSTNLSCKLYIVRHPDDPERILDYMTIADAMAFFKNRVRATCPYCGSQNFTRFKPFSRFRYLNNTKSCSSCPQQVQSRYFCTACQHYFLLFPDRQANDASTGPRCLQAKPQITKLAKNSRIKFLNTEHAYSSRTHRLIRSPSRTTNLWTMAEPVHHELVQQEPQEFMCGCNTSAGAGQAAKLLLSSPDHGRSCYIPNVLPNRMLDIRVEQPGYSVPTTSDPMPQPMGAQCSDTLSSAPTVLNTTLKAPDEDMMSTREEDDALSSFAQSLEAELEEEVAGDVTTAGHKTTDLEPCNNATTGSVQSLDYVEEELFLTRLGEEEEHPNNLHMDMGESDSQFLDLSFLEAASWPELEEMELALPCLPLPPHINVFGTLSNLHREPELDLTQVLQATLPASCTEQNVKGVFSADLQHQDSTPAPVLLNNTGVVHQNAKAVPQSDQPTITPLDINNVTAAGATSIQRNDMGNSDMFAELNNMSCGDEEELVPVDALLNFDDEKPLEISHVGGLQGPWTTSSSIHSFIQSYLPPAMAAI